MWPEKLFAGDVGAPVGLGGTPRLESVEVRMPSWELAPGREAGCHSRRTERILTLPARLRTFDSLDTGHVGLNLFPSPAELSARSGHQDASSSLVRIS